jgi:large subunit ribosomal protein L19
MDKLVEIMKNISKKELPNFNSGDTVSVHVKIKEGDKERTQVFKGTVIQRKGSGVNETFTVRKISHGVGVERIFLLHSPKISKIFIIKSGKVRKAKLFYLRKLKGKSARITEKK